jgi:hypothetical protein
MSDGQLPLTPPDPAALQQLLTGLTQPGAYGSPPPQGPQMPANVAAQLGQTAPPNTSPAAVAPNAIPQANPLLAGLSPQSGAVINPSQGAAAPAPAVQDTSAAAQLAQIPMGPGAQIGGQQSQAQPSGVPKQSYAPLLARIMQAAFGKGAAAPTAATGGGPGDIGAQPGRPGNRLDAFEGFLGEFLNSFASGMANAGHGPGATGRGFGAAVQAPYERQLQQYQLQQEQQRQQAQVGQTQAQTGMIGAQTAGVETETEINQRRLAMMGQAMATGQDPVASLGKLSSDEQAVVNAAKTESQMKGDMTPLLQAVDKVTNMRALSQRQQVGINAANVRATQALGEKMREFKITDEYRKWKENLDIQTKNNIAQLAQNKAPAAMQESAVFAKSGLNRLADAQQAMDELKASGVMGTLPANKVEDYLFGKGLVDPSLDAATRQQIGKLRSALSYTSTAAMRSHTGRTSQEIFEDFKNTLGPGQDWDALTGAMGETRDMLTEYANAPSDANIRAMRAGQSLATGGGAAAPAKPKAGGAKTGAPPTAADMIKKYPPAPAQVQ